MEVLILRFERFIYGVYGIFIRNIKIATRQKQLLVAPIVLPIVIMIFTALVMGASGDQWPIAMVNKSNSNEAKQLEYSIESSHSNISKYYNIIENDEEKSKELVQNGNVQLGIVIPENFAHTNTIYTQTFNVNTDMMKNVRLRLENSIINNSEENNKLIIKPVLKLKKSEDVWRASFISGSCFLLSLFFGACITGANLFAFDRENRTRKEIILTPLNLNSTGIGIVLSSLVITIVTSLPTLLIAIYAFKMKVNITNLILVYSIMIPVMIVCCILGMFLAHLLKNYRNFQPVIIVTAMATFFASGGFVSVAVLPSIAQTFDKFWLLSYVFEILNPILHDFASTLSLTQICLFILAAAVGLVAIHFIYIRERKLDISYGK